MVRFDFSKKGDPFFTEPRFDIFYQLPVEHISAPSWTRPRPPWLHHSALHYTKEAFFVKSVRGGNRTRITSFSNSRHDQLGYPHIQCRKRVFSVFGHNFSLFFIICHGYFPEAAVWRHFRILVLRIELETSASETSVKVLIAASRSEIMEAASRLIQTDLIGATSAEAAFRRAIREKVSVVYIGKGLPNHKRLVQILRKYRPSIRIEELTAALCRDAA